MKNFKKRIIITLLVPFMLISATFRENRKVEAFALETSAIAWAVAAVLGVVTGGAVIKGASQGTNPVDALKDMTVKLSDGVNSILDPLMFNAVDKTVTVTGKAIDYTKEKIKEISFDQVGDADAMDYGLMFEKNGKLMQRQSNIYGNIVLDYVGSGALTFKLANGIGDSLKKIYDFRTAENEVKFNFTKNFIEFPGKIKLDYMGSNYHDTLKIDLDNIEYLNQKLDFGYHTVKGADVFGLAKSEAFQAFGVFINAKLNEKSSASFLNQDKDYRHALPITKLNDEKIFVPLPYSIVNYSGFTVDKEKTMFASNLGTMNHTFKDGIIYEKGLYDTRSKSGEIDDLIASWQSVTMPIPKENEIQDALLNAVNNLQSGAMIKDLDFTNENKPPIVVVPPPASIDFPKLEMSEAPDTPLGKALKWFLTPIVWLGDVLQKGFISIFEQAKELAQSIAIPLNRVADWVGGFKSVFTDKLNEVIGNIKGLGGVFTGAIVDLKDLVIGLPAVLSNSLASAFEWAKDLPLTIANAISNAFSGIKGLSKTITDAIIDALKWLFVLDHVAIAEALNKLFNTFMAKFPLFMQLHTIISAVFFNIDSGMPSFKITMPEMLGGGTFEMIDFAFFDSFMPLIRYTIAGFVWVSFIMSLFRKFRVE